MPEPERVQNEEIMALRAKLRELLVGAEAAGSIKLRERLIVECHFALNDQQQRRYETYTSIAKKLGISTARVCQIQWRTMLHLRDWPVFCQAMNHYLHLFPYPKRRRRPTWLAENGLLKEFDVRE